MKNLKHITDFLVKLALAEDVGHGDITSRALIPAEQRATAKIIAKEKGTIAGLLAAREVFRHVDKKIRFRPKAKDGREVQKGQVIAVVFGPARGILTGERTALNFLQHLSGIATLTKRYKLKIKNSKVKILDTRKTVPGMRLLEKYAVKVGGGTNHRLGLYDAVLIKDNHIKLAGGVKKALEGVKRQKAMKAVEIEARTIKEVNEAVQTGVKRILLDNMDVKTLRAAVKLCKKAGIQTEASGGVNLGNIAAIAKTGVDYISVGALTHSAPALDISLKI